MLNAFTHYINQLNYPNYNNNLDGCKLEQNIIELNNSQYNWFYFSYYLLNFHLKQLGYLVDTLAVVQDNLVRQFEVQVGEV